MPISLIQAAEELDDGRIRVKVPVKRLHSRHRRYIAPGKSFLSDQFIYVTEGSDFELRIVK